MMTISISRSRLAVLEGVASSMCVFSHYFRNVFLPPKGLSVRLFRIFGGDDSGEFYSFLGTIVDSLVWIFEFDSLVSVVHFGLDCYYLSFSISFCFGLWVFKTPSVSHVDRMVTSLFFLV